MSNIDDMNFGPEEVAHYLRTHPEFFEDHADMLTEIQVPHPHGGGAIPISQRQIVALRDKNRVLQEKLAELIRFGEENDAIADKMHRLAVLLLMFKRLSDLVHDLNFDLRENFSVPHTVLRLWNITSEDSALPEFSPTSADIHAVAESLVHPYCGTHIMDEIHHWFGEDAHAAALFCDGGTTNAEDHRSAGDGKRGSAAVLSGNGNGLSDAAE